MGDANENLNPLDPDTAREFVDVVMASGVSGASNCSGVNATQVTDLECVDIVSENSNIKDTRKRRNSDDEHDETSNKKHKHACESPERGDVNISSPDSDVNINLTHLFKLVEGISLEVRSLNDRVFTRIEKLETNFTRNIAENMTKMMDIKIQKEVSKVKSENHKGNRVGEK